MNEAFPNPLHSYIDPSSISFTIHYLGKGKSGSHSLNTPTNLNKFKPELNSGNPLTEVPHAIRFILNFSSTNLSVSILGHFAPKQKKTQPVTNSIYRYAPPNSPENDSELIQDLPESHEVSYINSPEAAEQSQNYSTYLDLARSYMKQASTKHQKPVHMPTALRTLRSAGRIPASAFLGLILMELQKELGHGPENTYYPAPLT